MRGNKIPQMSQNIIIFDTQKWELPVLGQRWPSEKRAGTVRRAGNFTLSPSHGQHWREERSNLEFTITLPCWLSTGILMV
jgi:hypothetical protein